jgi:plasmid stabilization system protein ParE
MVTRIEWTDTAYNRYREIIFYYKQNDARKAAYQFEEDVLIKLTVLKSIPLLVENLKYSRQCA